MAWAYKGTFIITHAQCGSVDSSMFPVMVKVTDVSLKTTAYGGQIQHTGLQSPGGTVTIPYDLIFTSDAAGSSKIPWEFESYDASAGSMIVHVRVATLTCASDTIFYCFYGDASVSGQQSTGSFSPLNVWTSYNGVWHMGQNPTLGLADGTANGYNLTNHNAAASVAGQIVGAASFAEASSQYLESNPAPVASSTVSISFWRKATYSSGASGGTGTFGFNTFNLGNRVCAQVPHTDNTLYWDYGNYTTNRLTADYTGHENVWTHVVLTGASGGLMCIYLDGTLASSKATSSPPTSMSDLTIGSNLLAYDNGYTDEFRISPSQFTQSWITAEHNNQKTGSTFLSAVFDTAGTHTYNDSISFGLSAGTADVTSVLASLSVAMALNVGTAEVGKTTDPVTATIGMAAGISDEAAAAIAGLISLGSAGGTGAAAQSIIASACALGSSMGSDALIVDLIQQAVTLGVSGGTQASMAAAIQQALSFGVASGTGSTAAALVANAIALGLGAGLTLSVSGSAGIEYNEFIGFQVGAATGTAAAATDYLTALFASQEGTAASAMTAEQLAVIFGASAAVDSQALLSAALAVGCAVGAHIGNTATLAFSGQVAFYAYLRSVAKTMGPALVTSLARTLAVLPQPRIDAVPRAPRVVAVKAQNRTDIV